MWSEKPEENPLYDISSHVLVFRMITSILTMNPEKTTTEKELVLSVSRSWLKHLGTIDKAMEELEAAIKTMEESKVAIKTRAKQIADCFFEIFESPCALKRLSREIDADNSLNINEFLLSAFESLDRCVGLCENLLITNKLVDKMSRYANGFVYISQKHICTWWSAQYPIEAYTNFRLAHFALIEAVRRDKTFIALLVPDEAEEDEEFEQFKKVSKASEQWDKGKKTDKARRFRCRAMALRYYGLYEKAVSDIENGLRVLGISDYSKIEEPVQSDDSSEIEEIFKLHDRLGRVFFGWSEDARENITAEMENKTNELKFTSKQQEPNQGHLRTALNAFNRALGYKPRGQENNQNWKEGINMTYQLKAKVEALLGEAQQCLESVDKATHTAEGNVNVPENRDLSEAGRETMLVYFNEIVIALTKLSSNENVLSLLEKVPIQQLALGCADKTHEALHQAMSKSYETPTSEGEQQAESRNNEGKKRLGKMYEEAAKRLRNDYRRLPSNLMRVWWAIFTRHTCKDRKRAKEILQEALQPVVEGDIEAITPASWQLAEILLDEFWSNESASNVTIILTERQAVYEKTKELMETVKAQVPGFQPELAQISIPLAMMHRELGSLATFKNHAYGIFDACRSALTDGLASNDQPSFQLLAKLLALIPGLEEEATVTFTCQFYTVDMERRRQEAQAELSSTSLDSIPTLQLSSRLKSRKAYRVIRRANVTPEDEIACYVECSGRCGGILTEKNLQTHKAFLCYYCTNTILCGSCHKSWEKWKGGPGQRALGVGCESFHRHVEAPAKIWTKHQSAFFGKDPKKNLENLKEWLEDLERKWEEQWIIFMKTRNESKQAGLQQL
jgi:tetratricopeptide (TPR) repeat protein